MRKTYDSIDRLASIDHDLAGTAQDVTYTFSSYSPASQLLAQSRDNDSYGFPIPSLATTSYSANGLNQYTVVGADSPTYDDNGNLTSDGAANPTSYGYDVENRLISASGASSALLDYDPMGRLFGVSAGASTTDFLYDGDALVAEYDSSGNLLRRYVHGSGVDEPLLWYEGSNLTNWYHLRADHLGSIVAIADDNGNSDTINTFDEYGKRGAGNDGRFQYTGQILIPEIGLYHYKARMYSAELGRFLQTDPIGYEDQMNLYAYVRNDPINRIDPTGTCGSILKGVSAVTCTAYQVADTNDSDGPATKNWPGGLDSDNPRKLFEGQSQEVRDRIYGDFEERLSEIRHAHNDPTSGLSAPEVFSTFRRVVSGFLGIAAEKTTETVVLQTDGEIYVMGIMSLHAHRKVAGSNRLAPHPPAWKAAEWRFYDYGGSLDDTLDFFYWIDHTKNRPPDSYIYERFAD